MYPHTLFLPHDVANSISQAPPTASTKRHRIDVLIPHGLLPSGIVVGSQALSVLMQYFAIGGIQYQLHLMHYLLRAFPRTQFHASTVVFRYRVVGQADLGRLRQGREVQKFNLVVIQNQLF